MDQNRQNTHQNGQHDNQHHHAMDRELVSHEPHELEYLARTHGASVDEVKAVIGELGTRSRKLIEAELDKRYQHRGRGAPHGVSEATKGTRTSAGGTSRSSGHRAT